MASFAIANLQEATEATLLNLVQLILIYIKMHLGQKLTLNSCCQGFKCVFVVRLPWYLATLLLLLISHFLSELSKLLGNKDFLFFDNLVKFLCSYSFSSKLGRKVQRLVHSSPV